MPEKNASEQVGFMQELVELAEMRTKLARLRSELSAERSYMNAERTLSVWVRTALALMIVGIAVDRFGLLLHQLPGREVAARSGSLTALDSLSTWSGVALVALAVVMALTTGLRFLVYARAWRQEHDLAQHHGPYLAPTFALLVAGFGIVLLVIMALFAR